MPRRAEQPHGIEPRDQRGPGVVQDGVRRGRDLEAALGARIDPAVAQLMELAFDATAPAEQLRSAEANPHDMFQTGSFVGEPSEEVAD